MNVSIVGASGYSGIELIRLLERHPSFRVTSLHSSSRAGQPIHIENPHLSHCSQVLCDIDVEAIAQKSDVVFLATPSGIASGLAKDFLDAGLKVIDLSGDHRLRSPEIYANWYNKSPADREVLSRAVYGLSEWNAEEIRKADLIANPGCFPTAVLLGLAPLLKEKACIPGSIVIDAKSGVSGAGRSASLGSLFSEVNENVKIYKVHQHQHIPEIEQQMAEWQQDIGMIEFNTHLIPMTRGIMATIYVQLADGWKNENIQQLYKDIYHNQPFVRVQQPGVYPCTKQVMGSNYCDIAVSLNDRTGRVTIVSVIDNLVKGAAGQAIQNANILCGYNETAGLMQVPLFP
ncbi:N-acetyl-gamma-glutamyl-phosphate reductase [Bacillus testis]|uniref:N-acetyl-gamma-glutamyl-phosphate reductase n=1 Tax=Bacillus testis TaxID=1622072 RepID=UPI00067E8165|nr:N-acetyl-gamma-glutamyl-phosphate reductase [Bacillus testis]